MKGDFFLCQPMPLLSMWKKSEPVHDKTYQKACSLIRVFAITWIHDCRYPLSLNTTLDQKLKTDFMGQCVTKCTRKHAEWSNAQINLHIHAVWSESLSTHESMFRGMHWAKLQNSRPKVQKLFSCPIQLSMNFVLLINIKILAISTLSAHQYWAWNLSF